MSHFVHGAGLGRSHDHVRLHPARFGGGRLPDLRAVRLGRALGVLLIVATLTSCQQGSDTRPVAIPKGPVPADLGAFVGNSLVSRQSGSFGLDRISYRPSGDERFPWMARVVYPAQSASPSVARKGAPEGGAQEYLPLRGGPVEALHLRYYLRFPQDFMFVKGGKLPGLYGGDHTSGGHTPDGTDGLSTRFMWRKEGDGEVYAYLSDSPGTSLGRGRWKFTPGSWSSLEQRVQLNNPGKSDGSITVWLNDEEVFSATGLTFRISQALKIEGVFFSTFFGGGDPSWATPRDQHVDFADFAVSDHRIGL